MILRVAVTHEMDFSEGRGDVRLVVKRELLGEFTLMALIASSTAMIQASKPWAAMLCRSLRRGNGRASENFRLHRG